MVHDHIYLSPYQHVFGKTTTEALGIVISDNDNTHYKHNLDKNTQAVI